MSGIVQVFGRRRRRGRPQARRPASEKRRGTKSREVGAPSVPRALWGFSRGVRCGQLDPGVVIRPKPGERHIRPSASMRRNLPTGGPAATQSISSPPSQSARAWPLPPVVSRRNRRRRQGRQYAGFAFLNRPPRLGNRGCVACRLWREKRLGGVSRGHVRLAIIAVNHACPCIGDLY